MTRQMEGDRQQFTAVLTINLAAIRNNYRLLKSKTYPASCAAVVKANGYGLGCEQVATALFEEGCHVFFVATIQEAITLRHCLNEATIYCLDGLLPGTAHLFAKNNLQPVLGSMAEIEEWGGYCRNAEMNLSAAIHIDTGMQRLGLPPDEVRTLKQQENIFDAFKVSLVMSHLACADEPNVDFNKKQAELFQKLRNSRKP